MIRCPITYEQITTGKYSKNGLRLLSRSLKQLQDFPYSSKQQLELAIQHAAKLSIAGVQPKLSVRLNAAKGVFEIVDAGGTYIFKPPHHIFDELPQNEDLTMRLAKAVGVEVPLHGMVYNQDGTLTYFIKRFDRIALGHKLAVEDFSQLLGYSRDTKYNSSMEKLISVIEKHCTFPKIEKLAFFRLTICNFLLGNEDMHLKNFSLIRRPDKVQLSPAYDLVNSSILVPSGEELALPLAGKKSNLKYSDFVEYFGVLRLGLSQAVIADIFHDFSSKKQQWLDLIQNSFLSEQHKDKYVALVESRWQRLSI